MMSSSAIMSESMACPPPPHIPVIDMSMESRSRLAEMIVKSCEEFGMFKVINHGVAKETVAKVERQANEFFGKTGWEKEKEMEGAYCPPFGYGCKNIGCNGDVGELEYLILPASSGGLSSSPADFRAGAVNDYVKAVADLACEVLELVAEGLDLPDKTVFSRMIRDPQSDSILRFNYYPTTNADNSITPLGGQRRLTSPRPVVVGFGEHTDPQIITVLRSNDGAGLEIYTRQEGIWIAVPPDPHGFYVMVGDSLQVMSNGRFESVKHRVIVTPPSPQHSLTNGNQQQLDGRMSTVYFGAPPLDTTISPLPYLATKMKTTNHEVNHQQRQRYRSFTWSEYKTAAYNLRLGDCRLDLFQTPTIH